MKPDEATVFLIDPDESARNLAGELVCTMNLKCRAWASGREFLDAYRPSMPGCVLLEVRIPHVSGLEIQQRLSLMEPPPPVVFLTRHATVSIAVRAMRSGALNFLEKPARENDLWDTILEAVQEDACRREAWASRQVLTAKVDRLNAKERSVFELVGSGITKQAMADELGVCVRTVEIHRSHLMNKLGIKSKEQLIYFAVLSRNGDPRAIRIPREPAGWGLSPDRQVG